MKKLLIAACLMLFAGAQAASQTVQQSGSVTAGHAVKWTTNGIVSDAGTAANGGLTSLGVTFNGNGICQNSAAITGAYNQICLGVTPSGGVISLFNNGGATGGLAFNINGTTQGFGAVTLPVTANDAACFANTAGNLKDCAGTGVWTGTPIGLAYGGLGGSQAAATVGQIPMLIGSVYVPTTPPFSTSYPTVAAAAAASIPSYITAIHTAAYASAGDNGAGDYVRISHCAAPTLWQFNSADGSCWALYDTIITPEQFGAVGNGSTNNTAAFSAIATYTSGYGHAGLVINFLQNANYAVWPTDPGNVYLMQFSGVSGLTSNANGAKITSAATFSTQAYVFGFTGTNSNIIINNPHFEQTAYGNTTPTDVAGSFLVSITDNASNVIINNPYMVGGEVGLAVTRTASTNRATGITVNGGYFSSVFYPFSFQKNGDSVTINSAYLTNVGRAYFPYNVKHHNVSFTENYVNNADPTLLLKLYALNTESDDLNTLEDINVDVTFTQNTVVAGGVSLAYIDLQQGTATTARGFVKDVHVRLNGAFSKVNSDSAAIVVRKVDYVGNSDTATRGYVLDNITFSGTLDYGYGPVTTLTAFNGTTGGTETWYSSGTASSIAAGTNSFTGVISGNVLTASAVTGSIYPGTTISGGYVPNTVVVSQLGGTPDGAGTYQLSVSGNVLSSAMTGTYGLLTVGGSVAGTFAVGDILFGTGVVANTHITQFVSGSGGAGTYAVDNNTVVSSTTIVASDTVRNLSIKNLVATNTILSPAISMNVTNLQGPIELKNVTVDQPITLTGAGSNVRMQNVTAPGTADRVAIRDTSAAFDVTIAAASNTALTAGRTLTLNMQNVSHIFTMGTTASTGNGIIFPNTATDTVAMLGLSNTFTAANALNVVYSDNAYASGMTIQNTSNVGLAGILFYDYAANANWGGTLGFWNNGSGVGSFQGALVMEAASNNTNGLVLSAYNGPSIKFTTGNRVLAGSVNSSQNWTLTGSLTVSGIVSDATHTTATVCEDTTSHLFLFGSGTLGICLGTSGRQFKIIDGPMSAGIDELMKINLYDYHYRKGYGDSGKRLQYGAMAQDVESVIPMLAGHDGNGDTINYDSGALLFVGLRAIQQLKADNDNLHAEIRAIKTGTR